jgi:hypothetical protein
LLMYFWNNTESGELSVFIFMYIECDLERVSMWQKTVFIHCVFTMYVSYNSFWS